MAFKGFRRRGKRHKHDLCMMVRLLLPILPRRISPESLGCADLDTSTGTPKGDG